MERYISVCMCLLLTSAVIFFMALACVFVREVLLKPVQNKEEIRVIKVPPKAPKPEESENTIPMMVR